MKEMNILHWHLLCFLSFFPKVKGGVSLSPYKLSSLEGNDGTVSCIYTGKGTLQGATFTVNESSVASIFLPNCTLNVAGNHRFKTSCEGNFTFKLTWINLTRSDQGKSIHCIVYNSNGAIRSKNNVSVNVNVSVKYVMINASDDNGTLSDCEPSVQSFNCISSAARPVSTILWIFKDKQSKMNSLTVRGNETITDVDGLFITESVLFLVVNKSLNNHIVFCQSSNIPREEVHSRAITLDIRYPPHEGPSVSNATKENRIIYNIIEGREGKLTCTIPIANPIATLRWDCSDDASIWKRSISTSKRLLWKASKNDTLICTCHAEHECNNWTKSVTVERHVLYPPIVMHMDDLTIVEGSKLNRSCNVTFGIPELTEIEWTRQKGDFDLKSKHLLIRNVSRNDDSLYICTAMNNMAPTIGPVEIGTHSGYFNLAVLYPPKIYHMHNQTIKEGSDVRLPCQIVPGNPSHTEFMWTINDGHRISEKQILLIKNLTRRDSNVYTCTASNTMVPTGFRAVPGISIESFYLNVQYEATVVDFLVNGYVNITVNESDILNLTCYVDSNPVSHTDIMFRDGKQLLVSNSNNISLTIEQVTCLSAGTYICNGRNKYNIYRSERKVFVQVNCLPKAHPMVPLYENVTTAMRVPVVLRFSALAYPAPTFAVWLKFNGVHWIDVSPNTHISIHQTGLNYSLTINKVTETDFGQYKLVIENVFGLFEQIFNINFGDKPNSPKGFQVLTKLLTPSSVTVQWFPSFNGGKPQHFVLNYTKSDVQRWKSKIISDINETLVNTTITGLESETFYQLFLYAENSIGRSDDTNILYIQTAKLIVPKEEDSEINVVGIAVGSGSCLIIISGIAIGILIFKKRNVTNGRMPGTNANSERNETTSNGTTYDEIRMSKFVENMKLNEATKQDTKSDSRIRYEKLNENLKEKTKYKESGLCYENMTKPNNSNTRETNKDDINTSEYINMTI